MINDLACAYRAGLHAIVINLKYEHHFGDEDLSAGLSLLQELSSVHVHPTPKTLSAATTIVQERCVCNIDCWTRADAPWVDFVGPLREIFNRALLPPQRPNTGDLLRQSESEKNMFQYTPSNTSTLTTSSITDKTEILKGKKVPLVPKVAIQIRCSDNSRRMGLVPFPAIYERLDKFWRGINITEYSGYSQNKASAKEFHIFIMTEHVDRQYARKERRRLCFHIITALQKQLSMRYIDSFVTVQRGFMFQSWYQFMKADLVICGASSFCLWPSLANIRGQVYLPMTPVIANQTALNFGVSNIHFIENYELYDISRGGAVGAVVHELSHRKPIAQEAVVPSDPVPKTNTIPAIKRNRAKVAKLIGSIAN